jgi:phosphate transport system protein
MTHLDKESQQLKTDMIGMWNLVISQLNKTREALLNFDKDMAHEVVANEKRVNGNELKIDRDCENIFALFNPVAIDLRFTLAVLKINSNLERTGDMADGIGRFILNASSSFDPELVKITQVLHMYEEATSMLVDTLMAFEHENTKIARSIFKRDEILNQINIISIKVVTEYIQAHPENTEQALIILSIIRKLERVGDHCKNIAEEIIFYIEAKVLKHSSKKQKSE